MSLYLASDRLTLHEVIQKSFLAWRQQYTLLPLQVDPPCLRTSVSKHSRDAVAEPRVVRGWKPKECVLTGNNCGAGKAVASMAPAINMMRGKRMSEG